MDRSSNLIKVFVGPEASAILLKSRLEEIGIEALIKNDSSTAFWGATPSVIDLYIEEVYLTEAEPIIHEFIQNNKSNNESSQSR
jgi:hypothetical protein